MNGLPRCGDNLGFIVPRQISAHRPATKLRHDHSQWWCSACVHFASRPLCLQPWARSRCNAQPTGCSRGGWPRQTQHELITANTVHLHILSAKLQLSHCVQIGSNMIRTLVCALALCMAAAVGNAESLHQVRLLSLLLDELRAVQCLLQRAQLSLGAGACRCSKADHLHCPPHHTFTSSQADSTAPNHAQTCSSADATS